jgi:asparagine synthase (glutamine-hydrolysing)
MHRYLAVIWDPQRAESNEISQLVRQGVSARSAEWATAYDGPGAMVVHATLPSKATQCYRLSDAGGVVLGRLFGALGTGDAPRPVRFDSGETRKIIDSAGKHLVERYWGSYFAVLFDAQARKHHVFRDPIGNVPCYHFTHRSIQIFFSHIEDCVRFVHRVLGLDLHVNRAYLTRWLLFSGLCSRECSIEGIEELPARERLTVSGERMDRAVLWNPAQIAATPREDSPEVAARMVRATVQGTIDAWASCYPVITHRLSGGLDSSIVAGCLAKTPSRPRINYVNFSIDVGLDQERLHLSGVSAATAKKVRAMAAHGDERHLARLVAERWQTPLIERQRDTAMDLSRLWQAPPSINPSMYFTYMELDDHELELVKSHGTNAFFSGQGGDSVFQATAQPFPAIDYVHLHGLRPAVWPHLLATARLSRESVWGVLNQALRHGLLRRPYRPREGVMDQPTLLRQELTASITNADFASPLAAMMSSLPAGKQNHLRGLHGGAFYDFAFHSGRHADHVDPLNSQPVWELMLQLPTYTILADGISRGLARRAFADILPPEIRRRTVKGIGAPFYQQVVRRNRRRLQEWLLDGSLVREGYLDRHKLDVYLAADEPFVTVSATQLLSYLAAEIWLQQRSSFAQESPAPARASA